MEKKYNWPHWYSLQICIVTRVIFWLLVPLLYYLNYSRIGGDSTWLFVVKKLLVTASFFYLASWIISKLVQKGKLLPLLLFSLFSCLWWFSWTYITYRIAQHYIPSSDNIEKNRDPYRIVSLTLIPFVENILSIKNTQNSYTIELNLELK